MLALIVLAAALDAADGLRNDLSSDRPRTGWSQPMRPAGPPQGEAPSDLPQGAGPRATSGGASFDMVAVARPDDGGAPGVSVAAAGAAPGSFVELTELDHGHTILALVGANAAPGGTALLSEGAFRALGTAPGTGIRVRSATPGPQDQTALRSGALASARIDAPEVLLRALRKRVPQYAGTPVVPPRAEPDIRSAPPHVSPHIEPIASAGAPVVRTQPRTPVPRSGYVVQVAALSAPARADALARSLGGRVLAGGGLYRVQLGPYGHIAAAKRARDEAARHGYRDARVSHTE